MQIFCRETSIAHAQNEYKMLCLCDKMYENRDFWSQKVVILGNFT